MHFRDLIMALFYSRTAQLEGVDSGGGYIGHNYLHVPEVRVLSCHIRQDLAMK